MKDIRQTKNWAKFIGRKGWKGVRLENGVVALVRPIPFLGSLIKIQRPNYWITDADITKLKRYKPLFIKIEPNVNMVGVMPTSVKFSKDSWPLIPTKTKIIDLNNSYDEILKKSSKDVRQSVKKAPVTVNIYKGDDINIDKALDVFAKSYKDVAKVQKFTPQNKKTLAAIKDIFRDKFYLFESVYEGKVNAGAVVLCSDDKNAFYMYAYSDYITGRKTYSAYKLLSEIIQKLKIDGVEKLDLEGLKDERFLRETGNWEGFSGFKNKWYGETVTFDAPSIVYFNKFFKTLFTLGTAGEDILDNIANSSKDSMTFKYMESYVRSKKTMK